MATSTQIADAIGCVQDQGSFLQTLLIDTLGWPGDEKVKHVSDVSYGWSDDDLRSQGLLHSHLQDGQVWQFQPFRSDQPWGIFLLEFNRPELFNVSDRMAGTTGILRKVLRGLVPTRRRDPSLMAWQRERLLFICTHNYQQFRFAYFKAPRDKTLAAPLAFFGWNKGDTHIRTLCDYNLKALEYKEEWKPDDWVRSWSAAFDVEAVTKRFFAEYAEVFEQVEAGVQGVPEGEAHRLYTQRLINRLMFLYFIQRKGWLSFQGDKRYLRALFNAATASKEEFLNDRLYWTFFAGLSTPNEDKQVHTSLDLKERRGEVPFLNGGLFDLEDHYDVKDKVKIPNAAFTKILDLFERYNFTVAESTPLDVEVAVDPEMLGKVFEELVTGRHETGSYYTPRPIVAFMCREALKHYLASAVNTCQRNDNQSRDNDNQGRDSQEAVDRFVDDADPSHLPDPETVLNALRTVKVCDPACGSGAYLLGMMQELLRLREALFATRGLDAITVYKRKLEIIQNNLYGVDIDLFAINIAKLRLWLSLTVDFEGKIPPPLPNLDFKIECGDSLTAPDPQEMPDLFRQLLVKTADRLAELKAEFLSTYGGKKKKLAEGIANEEAKLQEALHEQASAGVDWRVAFAEEFRNGGFDIVIANPPYVRQELISREKPVLEERFPHVYQGTADLYVYFYARGLELLREGGTLVYIAPNKFFRAGYGKKLRSYLARRTRLRLIIDFGDFPIFQAITYPAIVVTQKGTPKKRNGNLLTYNWRSEDDLNSIATVVYERGAHLPQSQMTTESWNIHDERTGRALARMRLAGIPLGDFIKNRIYYGIKTGFNDAFEIGKETKDLLVNADPRSAEIIKPWLRGRNINRWQVNWSDQYLLFTRRGIDITRYPAVKKYLQSFRQQLEPRPAGADSRTWPGRKPGTYKWYEVQDAIDYWQEFERPKIVYQVIATYQQFAFTKEPYVTNDKTWIIPDPPAGLLAILNSKVAWFFLDQVAPKLQGGAFELRSPAIKQLPIAPPTKDLIAKEKAILELARKGEAKSDEARGLEKDIDAIVVKLYGVAEEEKVIDEALAACANRFPFKETEEYKEYMRGMLGEE